MLPLGALSISAATYSDLTYSTYNGKVTITDCNTSASGALVIPSTIGGYPVTAIGYQAFYFCDDLTSIIIPDSVTSIGNYAFYYCSSLTSVNIPDGVTGIGFSAFYGCRNLTSITIPASVTNIGDEAFLGCSNLTSITIPAGVTEIGYGAFSGCDKLTSISLAAGNTAFCVQDGVLYSKDKTRLLQYPAGKSGSTYTVPSTVTKIDGRAFYDCAKLTSITIPNSVTGIGTYAFAYCIGLTSITIPNSVTSIASHAFWNCTKLASITMGSGITTIGDRLFSDCTALKAVHITDLTAWCTTKFYSFYSGPFYEGKADLYVGGERITNLVVPEGVTKINEGAFYGCGSLTAVSLPLSVTSVESYAFSSSVTDVYYAGTIEDRARYFSGSYDFETLKWHYHTHVYQNSCDTYCDTCGRLNENAHVYSNACDAYCDVCGAKRNSAHVYDNACDDAYCNVCNAYRSTTGHQYTDSNDYTCDKCGAKRDVYVSGSCGTSATWKYNYATGTLVISGSGSATTQDAWRSLKKTVVVIEEGITSLGGDSFVYNYGEVGVLVIPSTMTDCGGETFMVGARTIIMNSSASGLMPGSYDAAGYLYYYNTTVLRPKTEAGPATGFAGCPYRGVVTVRGEEYFYYSDDSSHTFGSGNGYYDAMCTSCRMPKDQLDESGAFDCELVNGTITITRFLDRSATSVTVPATIGGYPVTAIGSGAFYGCSNLMYVTLPDSITSIGERAFGSCDSLLSINIPEGVTSVGDSAFSGCYLLTSIRIPSSVTSVDRYAFSSCVSLEKVEITDLAAWCAISFADEYANPLYNGAGLYLNGRLVTDLVIPEEVTSIGSYIFYGYEDLHSVTIGKNVTAIGENAFTDCTNLAYFNIVDLAAWCGITFANGSANPLKNAQALYVNGNAVTELVIPEGVTTIGDYAFYDCDGITSVVIPDSVTTIGENAFYDCDNLTSVVIGDGVTTIPAAFGHCDSLTTVTIGKSVSAISADAFTDCASLAVVNVTDLAAWCAIPFASKEENPLSVAHTLYVNGEAGTNLVIPEGVTSIGDYAFYDCDNITSVVIPESVTSIGNYAFYLCDNLKSVYITDLAAWCGITFTNSYGNPLYSAQTLYVNSKAVIDLVIPEGVTTIGAYAFYGYDKLASVAISGSVTTIGDYAFSTCNGLASVVISGSVTTIGDYAFSTCNGLTSVVISEGVTTIGNRAFSYCHKLASLVIPEGVTTIGNYAFSSCTNLTSVVIPGSVTTIGNYAFSSCTNLTSVVISEGVTTIGSSAFSSCSKLTTVYIPLSVTKIPNYAFSYCSNIQNVYYGGNATDKAAMTIGSQYSSTISSATWHYNMTEENGHVYLAPCKESCLICGEVREAAPHTYDNACDTGCNACGETREVGDHIYDNTCDTACNECGKTRTPSDHVYNDACDADCNVCGATRTAPHTYTNGCDAVCNVCGFERTPDVHMVIDNICTLTNATNYPFAWDESGGYYYSTNQTHSTTATFTLTALKAGTVTIRYYTSTEANYDKLIIKQNNTTKVTRSGNTSWASTSFTVVAGDKITISYSKDGIVSSNSDRVYFQIADSLIPADEVEPTCVDAVVCSECGEIVKEALGHTYDNACDRNCNVCGVTRTTTHVYDNACDTACNVCGATRTITHTYDNVCDADCNVCGATRTAPHTYTNRCDAVCDGCGFERTPDAHVVIDGVCTFTNATNYPFAWDESGGYYYSTNQSHSTMATFTLTAQTAGTITIRHYTSTETNYDKLIITQNGITKVTRSGITSWESTTFTVVAGDTITISYSKDGSVSRDADTVYFQITEGLADVIPADEVEPTCVDAVVCSECGETVKEALGHIYDNACDATCNVCGDVREIAGHEYDNNCDADCNHCGTMREPAHAIQHVAAASPTCSENGNIEYWYCVDCGYAWLDADCTLNTNLKSVILPSLEHVYHNNICGACTLCGTVRLHEYDNACDTVCNECGATRTITHTYDNACDPFCNVCGEGHKPIHTVQHVAAVSSTCSENGNIEYWYCVDCGYAWLDADCTLNTNLKAVLLPLLDHVYDNSADENCNECGYIRGVAKIIRQPKSVCVNLGSLAEITFEATGDGLTYQWYYAKPDAPTKFYKTSNGSGTGYSIKLIESRVGYRVYCQVTDAYGNVICTDIVTLNQLPHAYSVTVVDATCTVDGLKTYICSVCGESYTEVIPATGEHVYDDEHDADCNVCGEKREIPGQPPVGDVLYGDCDGDGEITMLDSTLLSQYLSDWEVELDMAAADVDGDGEVTMLDSTLLSQYLSDWDVTLGP